MTTPDKMIPQNVEAEEAVLGSLLIDPEALFRVVPFLKGEDFYIQKNGWIYDAILTLHERREPIDFVTLCDELERREQLEEIGGAAYITSLINAVPSAIHAEAYGHIVERAAIRRRLINAATQIAQLAYQETEEIDQTVDQAEQALFSVSQRRITRDLTPIQDVIHGYYDRIEYLYTHRGEPLGVPTGFVDLDRLLGGLQRSDFIIVAARPSVGKTSLCLSFARNAARHGQHVAIFSLEMSAEQIVQRLVSAETGIDAQRLRLGNLQDDEWPLFVQATGKLADLPIFIDDTPSISALQLRTKARRLHAEHGLDLILVDYLQLMTGDTRSDNRVQEVSFISRSLKAIARELDVPVVSASQLSRAVEQRTDKKPALADLRESGCLAGDSLITLANSGRDVPIRELEGESNFNVWAINPETLKLEPAPVSRAFSTGVKPVFKIRTKLGREIRATANHQFLTIQGWKRLDQLMAGEHLALPRTLPPTKERQSMSNPELALLGHLIGDGCTLPRHAIQYTTRERDLAEIVADLAVEVFGEEIQPRLKAERTWYQVYLSSTRHHTHQVHSPVTEWLESLQSFGLRSHEKRIPADIFAQPEEAIAIFLRHLWATDGSIQLVKGAKSRPIAYYATSSRQLAQDVQSLLLRLGINAILRRSPQNGKGRDQHHVVITGKHDLEIFAHKIGAVGQHRTRCLQEVLAHIEQHGANPNRDIIPNAAWRTYVIPAMQTIGMTTRQMQTAIGMHYCGTQLYKQNMSRERAERVAGAVESSALTKLARSDIYWDRILSIEPDGEEQVYDLTVLNHHNFVANNILVHNSIEQDADVVMFIYRDEMYHPETERQHIADIIVAKHRNGPTGTVQLFFRNRLAQFLDAETRQQPVDF